MSVIRMRDCAQKKKDFLANGQFTYLLVSCFRWWRRFLRLCCHGHRSGRSWLLPWLCLRALILSLSLLRGRFLLWRNSLWLSSVSFRSRGLLNTFFMKLQTKNIFGSIILQSKCCKCLIITFLSAALEDGGGGFLGFAAMDTGLGFFLGSA